MKSMLLYTIKIIAKSHLSVYWKVVDSIFGDIRILKNLFMF